MKKIDLWNAFIEKNPHWEKDNVTLTPGGLSKLFNAVYDHGHKQGFENGKAITTRKDRDNKAARAKPKSELDAAMDAMRDAASTMPS